MKISVVTHSTFLKRIMRHIQPSNGNSPPAEIDPSVLKRVPLRFSYLMWGILMMYTK